MVITDSFSEIPSISVKSALTISDTSPLNDWNDLWRAIASISSINIIEGVFSEAYLNKSCILDDESPTCSPIKDVALIKYNGTSSSLASALTSIVLPVPGSP